MHRTTAPVTLALVLAGLAAVPATAHMSADPVAIDLTKTIVGVDTYMISIRRDSGFNILDGSFLRVTGTYPANASQQHAGGIAGVVKYKAEGCPTANGGNDCFVTFGGVSKKDVEDLRVAVGGFEFQQDPDRRAWGSALGAIEWAGTNRYHILDSDGGSVTYRMFVSIPGAASLHVDIHIHSKQTVDITCEVAYKGGFLRTTEDYELATHVDTLAAEAGLDGTDQTITVEPASPKDHLYAGHGPSWFGDYQFPTGVATLNTAAVTQLGVELPNGETISGTAFSIGSGSGIVLAGEDRTGDYRFFVDGHLGVGAQDVYTVGFVGLLAPAVPPC